MTQPAAEAAPSTAAPSDRAGWSRLDAGMIPIAMALVAALAVIFLDDRLDGLTEVGMRLAIAATIILIVLRQTLLLNDRRRALTRMDVATAQANAAVIQSSRTAELLSEAEERFRRLVEQIPATVYVDRLEPDRSDVSGNVYISPRVTSLTGFTPEELAADRKLWDSRIHADDQGPVGVEWDRHTAAVHPYPFHEVAPGRWRSEVDWGGQG